MTKKQNYNSTTKNSQTVTYKVKKGCVQKISCVCVCVCVRVVWGEKRFPTLARLAEIYAEFIYVTKQKII
jgi:hypothetical protein